MRHLLLLRHSEVKVRGASHQPGWTALVAKLIQQSGRAGE